MELMYPIAVIICAVISVLIFFISFRKKREQYTSGKKVANTKFIKESRYYKSKVLKHKIYCNFIKIISVMCIICTGFLIARPITKQVKTEDKYNRDVIISLDISTSQCEVNLELVKKFRKIVPSIKGDRIGIVLFNTAPIVYCPLTEDYDYVDECLATIEHELDKVIKNDGIIPYSYDEEGFNTSAFWYGGTVAHNAERGSSLIGDGLAGTVFSFPDIKTDKERTRIIVFATDNVVSGDETVSLKDACRLCKEYGINVYAYCPTVEMNKYTSKELISAYKKAVEDSAGGKFYTGNLDKMSTSIIDEIKETKASMQKTSEKIIITDHPEILLIVISTMVGCMIFFERKVFV